MKDKQTGGKEEKWGKKRKNERGGRGSVRSASIKRKSASAPGGSTLSD